MGIYWTIGLGGCWVQISFWQEANKHLWNKMLDYCPTNEGMKLYQELRRLFK